MTEEEKTQLIISTTQNIRASSFLERYKVSNEHRLLALQTYIDNHNQDYFDPISILQNRRYKKRSQEVTLLVSAISTNVHWSSEFIEKRLYDSCEDRKKAFQTLLTSPKECFDFVDQNWYFDNEERLQAFDVILTNSNYSYLFLLNDLWKKDEERLQTVDVVLQSDESSKFLSSKLYANDEERNLAIHHILTNVTDRESIENAIWYGNLNSEQLTEIYNKHWKMLIDNHKDLDDMRGYYKKFEHCLTYKDYEYIGKRTKHPAKIHMADTIISQFENMPEEIKDKLMGFVIMEQLAPRNS